MSDPETGFPPLPPASSDLSTDPTRVLREFVRLYLYQQRRLAHEAGMPARSRMLMLLCRHEPVTQSELGRVLGLEKSWVSRGVDQLVEEGWVTRTADTSDRRCVRLAVTEKGRAQAMALEDCFNRQTSALFSRMSPGHLPGFLAGLQELNSILAGMSPDATDTGEQA